MVSISILQVKAIEEKPIIVCTTEVIGSLVRSYLGDRVDVVVLVNPSLCPADFDIKPSDVYAIRNAEIAVLSNDTRITAVLADVFYHHGRRTVHQLVREWGQHNLEKYCSTKTLKTLRFATQPTGIPYITLVTPANINQLIEKSSRFRRSVRGEAIGRLG